MVMYTGGECGWCWDRALFGWCEAPDAAFNGALWAKFVHDGWMNTQDSSGWYNGVWSIPVATPVTPGQQWNQNNVPPGVREDYGNSNGTTPDPSGGLQHHRPAAGSPDIEYDAWKVRRGVANGLFLYTAVEHIGHIYVKARDSTVTSAPTWPPLARPPRGPRVFPQKSQQTSARRGPGSYY